ncbi:hypothetical protein [Haloarcula amylovorans]|uniref:hypothetical protein n=1 Tax=Haloarcula amylovorans TaxID=2562280 RepID=UPI0014320FE3|nr:hypothetical protein [Halomicroarcula amylolytica]
MAVDVCDDPRPMTVERASRAYYVYQKSLVDAPDKTSRVEYLQNQHGNLMEAERELLSEWSSEVTTALLSLRLSPLDSTAAHEKGSSEGGESSGDDYGLTVTKSESDTDETVRQWVPPLQLDERLHDPWRTVHRRLDYHLDGYDWEYCWVVSPTDSAATPHMHVYCWIRDPDVEITCDHIRPAVQSFAENAVGADPEKHTVRAGVSDAGVVETDPPQLNVDDEQVLNIYHHNDDRVFQPNTAGFAYLLHQRPDWVMRRLENDESTIDDEQTALAGAAIAWASSKKWYNSSSGLDT